MIKRLMKRQKEPGEIFLERTIALIKNLLIDNPNYSNQYFYEQDKSSFKDDTKERATHIIKEIEKMKHLIIDED